MGKAREKVVRSVLLANSLAHSSAAMVWGLGGRFGVWGLGWLEMEMGNGKCANLAR